MKLELKMKFKPLQNYSLKYHEKLTDRDSYCKMY